MEEISFVNEIIVEGVCVGAIGVSNGTEDQDVDVAQAGVRALERA
jgi:uncharacterized protein GlcG (DUF336 family)